jgi:hypothetical protein
LSHSTSPVFVMGFFEIGSRDLFSLGWLQTPTLLISASWVTRITSTSHQQPRFWTLCFCYIKPSHFFHSVQNIFRHILSVLYHLSSQHPWEKGTAPFCRWIKRIHEDKGKWLTKLYKSNMSPRHILLF